MTVIYIARNIKPDVVVTFLIMEHFHIYYFTWSLPHYAELE